jgi:hypothetical protein
LATSRIGVSLIESGSIIQLAAASNGSNLDLWKVIGDFVR